jgi:hypothetical protein
MYQQMLIRSDHQTELLWEILRRLAVIEAQFAKVENQEAEIVAQQVGIEATLAQILNAVTTPPPVGFVITETLQTAGQGEDMAAKAKFSKVRVAIQDNGTALLTATPTDAMGLATTLPTGTTTPVWTSSDPGIVVTPVATDATGLTATAAPATPPVLVTGVVATVTATLPTNPDGSAGATISGSTPADLSVVAGGPTGFQIAESGN